ncbi:hypothetical protein L0244_33745 [bacterium]|nr:hypothetical protein [bacterium]
MIWLIVFNCVASAFILLYIFFARTGVYSEAHHVFKTAANKHETDQIDISRVNTFTWRISKSEWEHNGDAKLSIKFKRKNEIPFERYQKEHFDLRIKINAYGLLEDGTKFDRVIRDWYYRTDDPLSPIVRMWSVWGGGSVEHGLAGILCRYNEDLIIEVMVTSADPVLAQARPKLRIVGDHPSSMMVKVMLVQYLEIAGLVISIILLVLINIFCAVR